MAYAAEQIVIKGIPVEQLNELTLDCVPGEHGILRLNGFLPSEQGEETLFKFSENDSISVCTDGGITIFSGILTKVLIRRGRDRKASGRGKEPKHSYGSEKKVPDLSGHFHVLQPVISANLRRLSRQ